MPGGAAEALRNEIADLRRLIHLVTDERVLIEIERMIDELEGRLREIEEP
jgi:hypothetical protein